MRTRSVKTGLLVVAIAVGLGLTLLVASALRESPMPYRFEGYQFAGSTRLAILSITNLGSRPVDFTRAKLFYADGWQPKWGDFIVSSSSPTIGGGKSGRWVFEVPAHEANWRVTCELLKHSPIEATVFRLSQYRLLAWTHRFAELQTGTFTSDWVSE